LVPRYVGRRQPRRLGAHPGPPAGDEPEGHPPARALPRGPLAALRRPRGRLPLRSRARDDRPVLPEGGDRAPRPATRLPRPAERVVLGPPGGPPSQREGPPPGRGSSRSRGARPAALA